MLYKMTIKKQLFHEYLFRRWKTRLFSGWLQVTVKIVGIEAGFRSYLGFVGVLVKLE
jgi:hypothetical protein